MIPDITLKPRSLGMSNLCSKVTISSDDSITGVPPTKIDLSRVYGQFKSINRGMFRKKTKGAFGGKKKK